MGNDISADLYMLHADQNLGLHNSFAARVRDEKKLKKRKKNQIKFISKCKNSAHVCGLSFCNRHKVGETTGS